MKQMAEEDKNTPEVEVDLKAKVVLLEESIDTLTERVKALEDAPRIPTPVVAGEPEDDPIRMLYHKTMPPRAFKESAVEAAKEKGWQTTPLKRNKRGEA